MNHDAVAYDPTSNYAPNFPNGGGPTPDWPERLTTIPALSKLPDMGFDWEGAATIELPQTDWQLKAGIRYGRATRNKHFHQSAYAGTKTGITFGTQQYSCAFVGAYYPQYLAGCYHGSVNEFVDSRNISRETHTMLDFTLGKDVGLGTIGGGVRIAQFTEKTKMDIGADPNYNIYLTPFSKYHDTYQFKSDEQRNFRGVGPEVTWDANQVLWGDGDGAEVTFDWGINASVLFGQQKVVLHHAAAHCRHTGLGINAGCDGVGIGGQDGQIHEPDEDIARSTSVTVPNLGGYLGASLRYRNSKLSLGYRADTFFNAMDGGQQTQETFNRGFYGPYLNVSLGL
jgi:hypothetical protein